MNKRLIILLTAVVSIASIFAQDSRQRSNSTIIADALAQLPAQDEASFAAAMADIANTGSQGIVELADMLVPADKGKNATIEYAINGIVNYVCRDGHDAERAMVRKGLADAIARCSDNPNRAFLFSQLSLCATADDASLIAGYLSDDYLADWAVRALAAMQGIDGLVLDLIRNEAAPRSSLAYLAYEKRLSEAEPILLGWLDGADAVTANAIYNALGVCGSKASIKALGSAAAAHMYVQDASEATQSYVALLNNIAAGPDAKKAVKPAEKLLAASAGSDVKVGALEALFAANAAKVKPAVLSALNSDDRKYRVAALKLAVPYLSPDLEAQLGKVLGTPAANADAKTDIINWMGDYKVVSQLDAILANVDADNDELALASIKAAGRIGGDKSLDVLVAALGGKHSDAAQSALVSFHGNISDKVIALLDQSDEKRVAALPVVVARRITSVADKVLTLTASPNEDVKKAAYKALAGVVTRDYFDRLCTLAANSDGEYRKMAQDAMLASLASLPAEQRLRLAVGKMNKNDRSLFYPIVANVGSDEALAILADGYKDAGYREAAFASLLSIDNANALPLLWNIACSETARADTAVYRCAALVDKYVKSPVRKYQLYRRGLEKQPTLKANATANLLSLLASTNMYQSMLLASEYLSNDSANVKAAAASTIRTLASRSRGEVGGNKVRTILEAVKEYYVEQSRNDADAGYAVDDINGMLAKLPADGFAEGFSAEKWSGLVLTPAKNKKQNTRLQKKADDDALNLWHSDGNAMKFAGGKSVVASPDEYENFEMWLEWRGGDVTMGVRSQLAFTLGGYATGRYVNLPDSAKVEKSVNPAGEWNTIHVKVVADRMTVEVNGVTTANNVVLATADGSPVAQRGRILIMGGENDAEFREMYIRRLPDSPVFELSAEEKAEGFEVLFDGTSMHNWMGNTTDYVPVDGTIYVTAKYGGTGNLYTKKEYSDFIYRFEFCFETEGVNNGIGIRTSEGVDAAYEGMEIQVLDHDAPIYRNLQIYQQHGSVYGIIPAKHVSFGKLGTWNTEEIRAVGDHITVTVNGEVIVDGNIREACKGHNIAPDGSNENPYTVDHRNHPGLFRKSGLISFCGHGAGVKFRNIRIKDLSK